MPQPECQQLEAHLNGDLPHHEATQFTAHLTSCELCHTAIAQQQWLEGLLRGSATAEAVPAGLYSTIDQAITRTRHRRQFAYGFAAMTAAAALFLAFGIDSTRQPRPNEVSLSPATRHQPLTTPVATFIGSDDMIVVTHDSPYPNVTIVEVYPTISARRRWQRETAGRSLLAPKQLSGDPS